MRWTVIVLTLAASPCWAQSPPTQAALDDAIRLGTVATLAPLCGLRDEAWSFDLRRATIMENTGAKHPDDPTLQAAPGSHLSIGALSFAEAEALEDFATAAPNQTCTPLSTNPDLARADQLVQTFRALRTKPGS